MKTTFFTKLSKRERSKMVFTIKARITSNDSEGIGYRHQGVLVLSALP